MPLYTPIYLYIPLYTPIYPYIPLYTPPSLISRKVYEVDPTDGNRYDDIANKGLAKQRRETIGNLPGHPFQLIVNFQAPGDPPVCVVAFFALEPDLRSCFDPSECDKFVKMFSKFIDIPCDESERRELWGIMSSTVESDKTEGEGSEISDSRKSRSPISKSSKSSWIPSDISWPDPLDPDPGTYPQGDFRNERFKLLQAIKEGPWLVRASVPSKPALLGRKVCGELTMDPQSLMYRDHALVMVLYYTL